jgi:16S rRNA G966 N2-methylase RsmD
VIDPDVLVRRRDSLAEMVRPASDPGRRLQGSDESSTDCAAGAADTGGSAPNISIIEGDALDLIQTFADSIDLLVTDPPYAFGGSGGEHALSATVAIVLREAARKMAPGSWAVVFAASSWRSTAYMIEAVRGILEPVRVGTWVKPESRTKVATAGWKWASVNAIALRKGKARDTAACDLLDHICAAPIKNGRRAELPPQVADWAVEPFAIPGGVFLDPFAGSGALPEAAVRAGMRAYGFERSVDPRLRLAA